MNDEPWPDLESMRCKFKVGDLVEYRSPVKWSGSWTEIPASDGDTGIIEKVASARTEIDLYWVRFFTNPQECELLSSRGLRKVE